MAPKHWRSVGEVCRLITLALVILGIVYAAGAKLGSIEHEITSMREQIRRVEAKLTLLIEERIHGRPSAEVAGRGGRPAGREVVGRPEAIGGLPQPSEGDGEDGEIVLRISASEAK